MGGGYSVISPMSLVALSGKFHDLTVSAIMRPAACSGSSVAIGLIDLHWRIYLIPGFDGDSAMTRMLSGCLTGTC